MRTPPTVRLRPCSKCKVETDDYYDHEPYICRTCVIQGVNNWRRRNPIRFLLTQARRRARSQRVPFDLTIEHLEQQWALQNGKCGVTGADLMDLGESQYPSLARKDRSLGYVCGNMLFVLPGMNLVLGRNNKVNFGLTNSSAD